MSVFGVKTGVKTWNDKPAETIQKVDKTSLISATQQQQVLGNENIGDLLNKVADPNYVDPSKKVRAVGSDKLDKDAFMKLMLAQMKNQDPTNPLKSHEMAAQLAQFTGVEQMTNINSTLTDIKNAQKPTESFQALNLIGKAVSGDSAKIVRVKGDKAHDFSYQLPDDAQQVDIRVRNEAGEVVRTVNMKGLKKGEQTWSWNGESERGNALPVGEYHFQIEAKNAAGKKLFVKTDFEGLISGISYSSEGPVLMVGNQTVKFKDVKKIVDPSLMKNDQKTTEGKKTDLLKTDETVQNNNKGAAEKPIGQANLDSVGMSPGLIQKVEKETKPPSEPKI